MKYLIIQGDGMGDMLKRPQPGPSALEAARTPNFDRVAGCGEFGLIHTIPPNLPPGSDVGNLALFGYDPRRYYTGRSPLEAAAMGVKLGPDDVAFRMNLVSLRGPAGQEVMDDFSGGHIDSAAAAELVAAMNASLADESFQFYPGVSYRHLMVWRNGQEHMRTTPPHDLSDKPIGGHWPTGPGAEPLNRIMQASRQVLAAHPTNLARVQAGHKAISQVWLWGQGKAPTIPSFESRYHLRGACISEVDLVRGVATYAGFTLITVPGATGYLDTDYAAMGRYGLVGLARHDLMFLHVEAPDEAGHQGSQVEKIKAIEAVDEQIVGPLLQGLASQGPFKICITSDHATPVSLKTHSRDPVPFALCTSAQLASGGRKVKFGESEAERTGTVIPEGHTIIQRLLAYGS
ncbi:MAG TPA: cofactor-independent phosphoglycerate mutase [bacterium]|nr:cofactor-independent phosphoglycerate mutase [bacterium]